MNSTISEDLAREHLTLEAVKCLKNISSNSHDVSILHKELLEINLSITAYVEESKKRLAGLRLNLAHDAKDSYRVVEILSDK